MIAVNIVVIRGGQHVGDRTHFLVKNASSEPMTDEELTEVLRASSRSTTSAAKCPA